MTELTNWSERYDGGDPYVEADRLAALGPRILWVQTRLQKRNRSNQPFRAFHPKVRLGVENARLEICADLPNELQVGFIRPGMTYPATVRLSNASGTVKHDAKRDMRGIAVRVKVSDDEYHDFLLTNGPVSHARDGREFVALAEAMAGSRLLLPFRMLFNLGPFTTIRMVRNFARYVRADIDSLAEETYWSRGAMRWGEQAGRLKLIPESRHAAPTPRKDHPDYLRIDIANRLREAEITFDLHFLRFIDEKRTPIENAATDWADADSSSISVARLIIPRQDIDSADGRATEARVDDLAFNPWHTTDEFRPLGHINRARKAVYMASSAYRLGHRFFEEKPYRNKFFGGLSRSVFRIVNWFVPWHRLPTVFSLLNLAGFRHVLRRKNLYDTEDQESPPTTVPIPARIPEEVRAARALDGSFNDLSAPRMGAGAQAGPHQLPASSFGRNLPLSAVRVTDPNDAPSPIEVSERLLAREVFLPAKSLNLLAAAWIQFQVHDWVDHARYKLGTADSRSIKLPLPKGRTWQNTVDGPSEPFMEIADNIRRTTRDPRLKNIPVFENLNTPWWDAGQIYGHDAASAARLREQDGDTLRAELRLDSGFLPENPDPRLAGIEDTGFNENWWLGLSLMHTLFVREHNAVVSALRREYPEWTEDAYYQTSRLVIAALIAKIHTVEWTPAILATETIDIALNANWYGAPKDWLSQLGIWLTEAQSLKGIPETLPDHHTAPYSLTEEFATVYRMHPLIPDDYQFYNHLDGTLRTLSSLGQPVTSPDFTHIQGRNTLKAMRQLGLADVAYSFGIAHPGAITLRNYPRHLRNFARENGERIDLAVVDLVRDRTRGIPPYNEFRRLLHKPKVRSFSEITSNNEWAREMQEIYRDVDRIDTMVGLLAENPPEGFGFSDTAFRVFILMASRRLQSDRFLTVDYRSEVYSPLGIDWVQRNGMKEVIERHCPGVSRFLPRTASAFAPWRSFGHG